jgi:hypothetical protein
VKIPDQAVEAAANILWLGGTKEPHRLRQLRAALEAAAPHMPQLSRRQGSRAVGDLIKAAKANAWDEGVEAGVDGSVPECDYARNPYRGQI